MEREEWPQEANELYEKIESEFDTLNELISDYNSNPKNPVAWFKAVKKLPDIADLVQCLEQEYHKVKEGREIVN